jgi:transcription antitermination factor NusG
MEMATEPGNMAIVREALAGITGVEVKAPAVPTSDRYLVMVRSSRERDAVDSYRRNQIPTYWPSYEMLVPTRQKINGHPVCVRRRIGIIPGYVFPEVRPGALGLDNIVAAIDYIRTFDGSPLLIRDADIQIIRRIEAGLNTPKPGGTDHAFKVGEKVRFSDDLDSRWPPGKIIKLAKEGRIIVEVDAMGRKLPITVFPHQIERT